MSFYIRYVLTDTQTVTVGELEKVLRQVDSTYVIDGDLIRLGEAEQGVIDITHRGDPICDDDLDLLTRLAVSKEHRNAILAAIQDARGMVCVQPLNPVEFRACKVLTPLWDWLLANRAGFLAWEGGQFFDRTGELK